MTTTNHPHALFAGLIYDEEGVPVETTFIGSDPHYVIIDGDFKRHASAAEIDRQVLDFLQKQAAENKDLVSKQMMQYLGKDDLFTKAMIDASITNMDKQVIQQGLPDDARMMLGMIGFKIIINLHGELVNLEMPSQPESDDGWE
jgi:hypothetical protein